MKVTYICVIEYIQSDKFGILYELIWCFWWYMCIHFAFKKSFKWQDELFWKACIAHTLQKPNFAAMLSNEGKVALSVKCELIIKDKCMTGMTK